MSWTFFVTWKKMVFVFPFISFFFVNSKDECPSFQLLSFESFKLSIIKPLWMHIEIEIENEKSDVY
jgi:hypothetical protein